MVILHPLADFIDTNATIPQTPPNYYYEGICPQTGKLLKLPRTALAEAVANGLMQQLKQNEIYSREGKMYGVLLVELPTGEQRVIKAFSGLLQGCSLIEGWVSPIPGREEVALQEARTLAELETIKQELISLQKLPAREEYNTLLADFTQKLQQMSDRHSQSKQQRQLKRQQLCQTLTGQTLTEALAQLEAESRHQGIERRHLKRRHHEILQPLTEIITTADQRIQELKQQRKALSRQLQAQMHAAYSLTNFAGQSLSLQQLLPTGTPTGTGDCCAPKLLHYAATHQLKPIAMAEFWWGSASIPDKISGEFYGACAERCQPLMGFLLSGISSNYNNHIETFNHNNVETFHGTSLPFNNKLKLEIIYEDEWLIAVNKPPELLSVPGRYSHNQDSVFSRLRNLYNADLMTVHRLDQDTSGILLLLKDKQTYLNLNQQFQQRQIHKIYEAILTSLLKTEKGTINLPLWGNPENRPYQQVDFEKGKPSITHFQVIRHEGNYTRIQFQPVTGRTHQLRVHAADKQGLGIPILGDKLYSPNPNATRLHLHARELSFQHPQTGEIIHLQTKTPF
ncbi:MAG TPA: RluA family pseudouridine synthase [Nostocaceae cyanobacterium]|nr:RluA family pseudouridine synthase [Nostocaceae cyanobacterium]